MILRFVVVILGLLTIILGYIAHNTYDGDEPVDE